MCSGRPNISVRFGVRPKLVVRPCSVVRPKQVVRLAEQKPNILVGDISILYQGGKGVNIRGKIITNERNRLLPENASKILFLRENLPHVNFDY